MSWRARQALADIGERSKRMARYIEHGTSNRVLSAMEESRELTENPN